MLRYEFNFGNFVSIESEGYCNCIVLTWRTVRLMMELHRSSSCKSEEYRTHKNIVTDRASEIHYSYALMY